MTIDLQIDHTEHDTTIRKNSQDQPDSRHPLETLPQSPAMSVRVLPGPVNSRTLKQQTETRSMFEMCVIALF